MRIVIFQPKEIHIFIKFRLIKNISVPDKKKYRCKNEHKQKKKPYSY